MSTCPHCNFGLGHPDMKPEQGTVICPDCGKAYDIPWFPLFVVTGGGGCGKTTVADTLGSRLDSCLIVEADDYGLVRGGFETNQDFWHYMIFLCMKLSSRNHRPVVLCGWVDPSQIYASSRLKFFSDVHILVLTCEADVQTARLKARYPKHRKTPPDDQNIEMGLRATQIMKKEAEDYGNVTVLDTTHIVEEQTLSEVARWIQEPL